LLFSDTIFLKFISDFLTRQRGRFETKRQAKNPLNFSHPGDAGIVLNIEGFEVMKHERKGEPRGFFIGDLNKLGLSFC
jgi:ribosomal protein L13E